MTRPETAQAGLRIASALPRLWDFRGSLGEAVEWLAAVLALPGAQASSPIRAKALTAYGYCLTMWGARDRAIAALDESLELYGGFGQPGWLAAPIFFRGFVLTWIDHDTVGAEPWFGQSLTLAKEHGPAWTMCCALFGLGDAARLRGDFHRAETLLAECGVMSRRLGDRWVLAYALFGLGMTRLQQGDAAGARLNLEEALHTTLELGDMRGTSYALECLARLALAEGHAESAARLFGAAQALREPVGDVIMATLRVDRDQFLADVRTQIDDAGFERASQAGRALSLEQIVREACEPAWFVK
jgi:non-specific serine/threonine protein kinase